MDGENWGTTIPNLLKVIKETSVWAGKGILSCLHLKTGNTWALPMSGGHNLNHARTRLCALKNAKIWGFLDILRLWQHLKLHPGVQRHVFFILSSFIPHLVACYGWTGALGLFNLCVYETEFRNCSWPSAGEETVPLAADAQISCSPVFLHNTRACTQLFKCFSNKLWIPWIATSICCTDYLGGGKRCRYCSFEITENHFGRSDSKLGWLFSPLPGDMITFLFFFFFFSKKLCL